MSSSENLNAHSTNYINDTSKGRTIKLPEGPAYNSKGKKDGMMPDLEGKQSMLHSLSVLHYTDFSSQGNASDSFVNKESRYYNGENATGYKNPTGSQIVSAFDESEVKHAMQYKWGDFLFLEDYGKVPNNHLVTLRRFPQPTNDNLLNNLENPNRDVSRLLTYIDGEDNTFESLFSFSAGLNFKEFQSESFAAEKLKGEAATNYDPYTSQTNVTWGPIDVIDKVMTRDRGINFSQDLTVKFKYAVRSYDGISTKVAFLDIIGNMLNMVTNKAPFWGGAVRFHGGGGHSGPMGDSSKLKSGDMYGFLKSFAGDAINKLSKPFEGGLMEGIKTLAGNAGAALAGKGLDTLSRPEMYSMNSLLTGTPTGEWHMTVGNPFNPAMMYGNLVMEDASFGFEGPFTADDIPSTVILEVKLKHAMPRDKYGIQRMFNYGGTRFYGSNIDFENKSYYRNRGNGNNNSGNRKTPLQIANESLDGDNSDTSKLIANNNFTSNRAALSQ